MFRRAVSAVAASAVVLGGLTFAATPATAAVSNASITPSEWAPSSQPQAVVTFDSSTASTGTSGNLMSIEIGWGWVYQYRNPSLTPAQYTATHSGTTYTCDTIGVTFQSTGFSSAPGTPANVKCEVLASSSFSGNPGQMVRLINTGTGGFTFTANSRVVVTFAAGTITAPSSGPASDTWRIIDVGGGSGVTVTTVVPGVDLIKLDFDGNGGICSPGFVEGYQNTWGTAPTAENCTFGARRLQGFSTSPTGASGSVFVQPGGPVFFLGPNRLYAIWSASPPSAPQDVVATPGVNSVTVAWKTPADAGSFPINGYIVAVKAASDTNYRGICSTAAASNQCKIDIPGTNQTYTFIVRAGNSAGSGPPSAGTPAVSPYTFGTITASRPNVLLGLGGSRVEASGWALGLAGKSVNAQYKVGNAKDWTTQANAATVNAQGKFSWSRKFAAGVNKQNVSVRFTYGTDLVSGTYVLSRGGEAGSLTAPRNIKVQNDVNRIVVTWDRPKFDGGEKITGYTMCASYRGSLCRNVSADGRGVFQGLPPGEYTITVEAKTATRTGPVAEAKKKVSPVEASVRITRRMGQEIEVRALATGFKAGAKFRLEAAVAVPGEPASAWRWEEVRSFAGNGNVNRFDSVDLGSSYEGETLAVRLVTPNGSAYSRLSRP